jgi:hypothetical protein
MSSGAVVAISVPSVACDTSEEDCDEYFCGFLGAVTIAFKESLASLEQTVGQVTEIIVAQGGQKDRNLLMVLQGFDRVQQEFANLTSALETVATARLIHGGTADSALSVKESLGAISIDHIKIRLEELFSAVLANIDTVTEFEDVVF